MTAEENTIPVTQDAAAPTSDVSAVAAAMKEVDTGALSASLSAIASARTGSLEATGSAIGMARVDGDAEARLSWVGLMNSKGASSMNQSYASAFVASEEIRMSQAASAMTIARTVTFEQSGSVLTISGNAEVRRGFIGVLLAPKADIAEDTRILISGRGLLVIALAMLGGFGLIALAMVYGANRVTSWRPNISLPELPSWARRGQ